MTSTDLETSKPIPFSPNYNHPSSPIYQNKPSFENEQRIAHHSTPPPTTHSSHYHPAVRGRGSDNLIVVDCGIETYTEYFSGFHEIRRDRKDETVAVAFDVVGVAGDKRKVEFLKVGVTVEGNG
ncbi:hypothetical protein Lal_00005004 [Lupinus albus]|nr:hypothetical protein Lal_00005004 [Lupinus albus]